MLTQFDALQLAINSLVKSAGNDGLKFSAEKSVVILFEPHYRRKDNMAKFKQKNKIRINKKDVEYSDHVSNNLHTSNFENGSCRISSK